MSLAAGLRNYAQRYPLIKSVLKAASAPFRKSTSSAYAEIPLAERETQAESLKFSWQSKDIPARQRKGVEEGLAACRAGVPEKSVDVLVEMLRTLNLGRARRTRPLEVLEVGCSSGYFSEVLAIKNVDCLYAGCDYSAAFIGMARSLYPALDFRVEDATAMAYEAASFDVVVSGCCLLHIPDYESAIREASRVARDYVVFHRTPVQHLKPTTYFTKLAYGVKTVEIHFNEEELVALFSKHGLRIVAISTLDVSWRQGDAAALKTYLCEKTDFSKAEARTDSPLNAGQS